MTGIVAPLTEDMRGQAWETASARDAIKHATGNGRAGTYGGLGSTVQMHNYSALAELVVQAAMKTAHGVDIQIDTSVSPRGNKRGNLIAPDYRAMANFRQPRGRDAALKTSTMAGFGGQVLFLVYPDLHSAHDYWEVAGWISRDEFAEFAEKRPFHQGKLRLCLHPSRLHSMSRLPSPVWERVEQGALFGESA